MPASWKLRIATVEDAPGIAAAHLRSWQTAYRGIFSDAFLDGMMEGLGKRTERWREGLSIPVPADSRTYVVEVPGSGIAGFVGGGTAREVVPGYPGELYAIYLVAEHRGQGIGRALFGCCREYLASLGHQQFFLWVIDSNPTCAFYRAMGGQVVPGQTKQATIGGTTVGEIVFGWSDAAGVRPARD